MCARTCFTSYKNRSLLFPRNLHVLYAFNACGCLSLLHLDVCNAHRVYLCRRLCVHLSIVMYNCTKALWHSAVAIERTDEKTNSPSKIHFVAISFPFLRFSNKIEETAPEKQHQQQQQQQCAVAATLGACLIHTHTHTNTPIAKLLY